MESFAGGCEILGRGLDVSPIGGGMDVSLDLGSGGVPSGGVWTPGYLGGEPRGAASGCRAFKGGGLVSHSPG